MNPQKRNRGRNTLMAVFLSFSMPGLGQVYNGELIKGVSFFTACMAVAVIGARWSVLLPDHLLIFGTLATFLVTTGFAVFAIVDAFNTASRAESSYQLKVYNRWYFYMAAWLVGRIVFGSVLQYETENYIEAYHIPSGSMQPAVLNGDAVLADKTAYQRMSPKKGDVVIFVCPDDRSQKFIKRIEGLPGDIVTYPEGTKKEVPHGYAYVLGDNSNDSVDSRQFGFVPLSDIVAKVRQVYYSRGDGGIRWDRIGTTINSG